MPSLKEYHARRDFRKSPEPKEGGASSPSLRRFVVQKHRASHLHYDFRLEMKGVLLSWAVPKGPSRDPEVKRLAIHVEDHPLSYADFEGVIPKGQYGGGTVMVWDSGSWIPEDDPERGYRKGKLSFLLEGDRLRGAWTLVRTGRAGGRQWLLMKRDDDGAQSPDTLDGETFSAASGRDMDEIAAGRRARPRKPSLPKLPKAGRAAFPAFRSPEKATLVENPPEGDEWLHEVKYDGYRLLAYRNKQHLHLYTRSGNDWSERFPDIRKALSGLSTSRFVLDGEVISPTGGGGGNFQDLQQALKGGGDGHLVYAVFDLLYLDGHDLTRMPLTERKAVLQEWMRPDSNGILRYTDHVVGGGAAFFEFACRSGLEGIICKKSDSPYRFKRSRDWRKVKCVHRQEFVIGGFTEPAGSRTGFGALLLGVYEGKNALRYAGKVGTGFRRAELDRMRRRLNRLTRKTPPFADPPGGVGIHWVRPELAAEVKFTEWTRDGHLRHPSFEGLREDKSARDIIREKPKTMKKPSKKSTAPGTGSNPVAGVVLSHPDKVLYPDQGVTKRELALYYERAAEWMLPRLVHRPLMLMRCPAGRSAKCFYQKHSGSGLPEAVKTVSIQEKNRSREYVYIEDLQGLISLVQMGTLEFHPWGSRVESPERPDSLVFDLDPAEDVAWEAVVNAAKRLRDLLGGLDLLSRPRTTGGKGVHVVVPLKGNLDWDTAKAFAGGVAKSCVKLFEDEYVATMSKSKRRGKIFIDHFRNARGATAIGSYSTRARPGAPVAVPLRWEELTVGLDRDRFTVERLPRRLAALKKDPWEGMEDEAQILTRPRLRAVGVSS